MSGTNIRIEGAAGRITLARPDALNALNHQMCLDIEDALDAWWRDDTVALVVIDAEGDKAFCAGGDITDIHDHGRDGNFEFGRQFWRDEYRLNWKMAEFPKPVISLMHGFTLGGGVGLACHGSHRVVCEDSRVALPEVGIGLIADIGASWLLAQAPGHLGEYVGLSAARLGAGDAIYAGLADFYIPLEKWGDLRSRLQDGIVSAVADMAEPAPATTLEAERSWIDRAFAAPDLAGILDALNAADAPGAAKAAETLKRSSPLAMACTLALIRGLHNGGGVDKALIREFRFSYRAMTDGDLLEGIRAALIDRDRAPRWRHDAPDAVTQDEVAAMLAPLGDAELSFERCAAPG